jgi:hypothetical protein
MSAKSLEKADDRLQRALMQAKSANGDVSALLVLRSNPTENPSRGEHRDKRAWQQEVAKSQSNAAATHFAPFLSELRSRGMLVRGGAPGRVVLVRGPAEQIVTALDADVVERASLDGFLDDHEPHRDRAQFTRAPLWLELRDVEFGPTTPVHLLVRGIKPTRKTLGLVAAIDGDDPLPHGHVPSPSGSLFVQGTGAMPLPVDPYDRKIVLGGVRPNQRVDLIRLYVADGVEPCPVDTLGISSVSPS